MKALDLPYDAYVSINGHEFCGICGRERKSARRHDRDHDHKDGRPRGLLCPGRFGCNRRLGRVDDVEWLRAAIAYLESVDERLREAGL